MEKTNEFVLHEMSQIESKCVSLHVNDYFIATLLVSMHEFDLTFYTKLINTVTLSSHIFLLALPAKKTR